MHSHEKTLLSKLGFADPDKRNPEHDRACLYLSQDETLKKIGLWLIGKLGHCDTPAVDQESGLPFERNVRLKADGSSLTEFHLQKGVGQYAASVGFLDVVYKLEIKRESEVFRTRSRTHIKVFFKDGDQVPEEDIGYYVRKGRQLFDASGAQIGDYRESQIEEHAPKPVERSMGFAGIFLEVKIAPVSFGDVLRQLNLYESHFDHGYCLNTQHNSLFDFTRAVLVAPWSISSIEAAELNKRKFAFLKLGDGYRDWCFRDKKTEPPQHAEI